MDQYLVNVKTEEVTDLNNTPDIWDEHGVLSPDGRKVVFSIFVLIYSIGFINIFCPLIFM
jgi:hypothetical protein